MRIGIFGGSFNPVHNGHIRLAREAVSELNLEKVIFVPSFNTPLKSKEVLLPARLRIQLLKTALKAFPDFSISLCEMKRKGVSFTVDTLKFFKRRFGEGASLFFLCGADTLKNLPRWKSKNEVLKLCRFVVMTRPGHLPKKLPAQVHFMPFDALPVSSSDIRKRLERHQSIRALVPENTARPLARYYQKRKGEGY